MRILDHDRRIELLEVAETPQAAAFTGRNVTADAITGASTTTVAPANNFPSEHIGRYCYVNPYTTSAEFCKITAVDAVTMVDAGTFDNSHSAGVTILLAESIVIEADKMGMGNLTGDSATNRTILDTMLGYISTIGYGEIYFPVGDYYIDSTLTSTIVPSNSVITIAEGATIYVGTGSGSDYRLFRWHTVSNCVLQGPGTINGDNAIVGTPLQIQQGCENITLRDFKITESNRGLISITANGAGTESQDIKIINVTCDTADRVGLAVIEVDGLLVDSCVFKNISGSDPEAGVDLEPNATQSIKNVVFNNCIMRDNNKDGIKAVSSNVPQTTTTAGIDGVTISNCIIKDNGNYGINAIEADNVVITGNTVRESAGRVAIGAADCRNAIISGNNVDSTGSVTPAALGAILANGKNITVEGNAVTNALGAGIRSGSSATLGPSHNVIVSNNVVDTTGDDGIILRDVLTGRVSGNVISGADDDGIKIQDCYNVDVIGNSLFGCNTTGSGDSQIYVSGSTLVKVQDNTVRSKYVVAWGTAAAGAASTITLESGLRSDIDDFYNGYECEILSGTGSGEIETISDYVGSTGVATIDTTWGTNPDNTSVYLVHLPSGSMTYHISIPSGNADCWLKGNDADGLAVNIHASAGDNAADGRNS